MRAKKVDVRLKCAVERAECNVESMFTGEASVGTVGRVSNSCDCQTVRVQAKTSVSSKQKI